MSGLKSGAAGKGYGALVEPLTRVERNWLVVFCTEQTCRTLPAMLLSYFGLPVFFLFFFVFHWRGTHDIYPYTFKGLSKDGYIDIKNNIQAGLYCYSDNRCLRYCVTKSFCPHRSHQLLRKSSIST
jgi:hypothetical protein